MLCLDHFFYNWIFRVSHVRNAHWWIKASVICSSVCVLNFLGLGLFILQLWKVLILNFLQPNRSLQIIVIFKLLIIILFCIINYLSFLIIMHPHNIQLLYKLDIFTCFRNLLCMFLLNLLSFSHPITLISQLTNISLRVHCNQINLILRLVLGEISSFLFLCFFMITVHKCIVCATLYFVDLSRFFFNTPLIVIYFLHHGRTHLVELILGGLSLFFYILPIFKLFHCHSEITLHNLLYVFTLSHSLYHFMIVIKHVFCQSLFVRLLLLNWCFAFLFLL